ncbi:uncharacterized protein [Littorina saxatilis]|uniref:Nucleotide-diphospho-sugar transferase domain-containing protein n=1 Tax=Littorina saxatilis TaxID=31220 RepID=A0AAN9BAB5_9CAEN
MVRIRKLSGPRKLLVLAVLSFSTTIVLLRISRMHASRDRCAETLTLTSAHTLRSAIINKCALPLLTLFSTWSDKGDTELTRKLTLRNWQQLKPYVVPVLFSNSVTLRAQAEQWGWFSMPVSNSPIGVPVLKHMYRDAMERFNTTLYAYANGDILFTDSLVDTLLAVLTSPALPSDSQALPSDSQALLVIGRRTNVNFVTDEESATLQNVSRVGRRGKLFIPDSQDYFITNRRFPWQSIPEFVVGRIAYDSWLTATSVTSNDITVVDATKTLLAVHQTVKAGNWAGFSHSNKHYNWRKVEKKKFQRLIRKHLHQTTCASWKTVKATRQGNITVTKRSHHEIKKANCLF